MSAQAQAHPVSLAVTDDLRRTRLTVLFRLLLAIPHALWLSLWAIAFFAAAIVAWFATLFGGRLPDGLHRFQTSYLVYQNRVYAYLYLVADPFPPFGAAGDYSVELEIAAPEPQSRLTVFFRAVLAIPALILASILLQLAQVIAFIGWFVCVATGRMPAGMRDLSAYCLRYYGQTSAYLFLLTPRYPSLAGGPAG